MKQSITGTIQMVITALFVLMAALHVRAGLVGSKHDLTVTGSSPYQTTSAPDPCVFCHTPRASWNRMMSTATYTMYTSPTMNMAVASTPQTYSAICLSCHDGTVALDALPYKPGPAVWAWNATGNIMTAATSRESMLGTDLRGEHPISMIYDTTKDRAFVMAVSGAVNGLPLYGTAKNLVECTTCHSVHDNTIRPFLRVANSGSALCFKCHLL